MIALVAGAGFAFMNLNYSWFVGFPTAFALYMILKKVGIEKKYEDAEAVQTVQF
jgi:NCS1 family nucleobase:cation symporter-1